MPNRLTPQTAASTQPLRPMEVYDADEDAMVTRSEEEQRQAAQLMQMVEMATLVKAVALARIADRKHYLDLGHSSFKDFAEASLPFGYRQAKKYVSIGRKFAPMLPEFDPTDSTEGNSSSLFLAENAESGESEGEENAALQLAGMSINKLAKLTSLDDEHFEDVVREGKIVMPDGETEYTLDELMSMKSREFADRIEEAKMEARAYRSRVQQLEEEKELIEAEREADQEKMKEARNRLKKARALEARHGEAARTYDAREKALSEAASHVREVRRLAVPLQMGADVEVVLCNQLLELVREMHSALAAIKQSNARALDAAEDTIEMDTSSADGIIKEELSDLLGGEEEDFAEEAAEGGDVTETLPPALVDAGWHAQHTVSGGYELICDEWGYTTKEQPSLHEAVDTAERIEEMRAEGSVSPVYRLES